MDTTTRRVERVRFVAGNFEFLRGLTLMPFLAVVALLSLDGTDLIGQSAGWYFALVLIIGLPVAGVLAVVAERYYRGRYGRVARPPNAGVRIIVAFVVTAVFTATFAKLDHDVWTIPISPEGLVVAVAAFVGARLVRPLAVPFGYLGALLAVASLVPLGHLTGDPRHPLSENGYLLFAVNLGWIVICAHAHLLLRRELTRPGAPT